MNTNVLSTVAAVAKEYGKLEAYDEIMAHLWQYKNCSTAVTKVQAMKTKLELQLERGNNV